MQRNNLLKVIIMAFLCSLLLLQTGCTKSENVIVNENNLQGKLVGLSLYSNYDDYTNGVVDEFSRIMDAEGIKYVIRDADGDVKKQISDIENLVAQNVDIIGIMPWDEKSIRYSLDEAAKRKIPIVSISQVPWVNTAVTISGGDYANGKGTGLTMRNRLADKGGIVILDYSSSISRTQERINGFKDAIKDTDIKILNTLKTSTVEETMNAVRQSIKDYPDLKGFFATDDNQLIGCGAALKALDRKDIVTTGVGSDISILNMIMEGYISAVAAKFPAEDGELMAQAVTHILKGESYKDNYEIQCEIIDRTNAVKMAKQLYDRDIK